MRFHLGDTEDLGEMMDAQIARVVELNTGLYNLARNKDQQAVVNDWHQRAIYWMQLADKAAADPAGRLDTWLKLGVTLGNDASDIAYDFQNNTLANKALAFAQGLPTAFALVARTTLKAAGEASREVLTEAGTVVSTAAVASAVPFMLIIGAIALGGLLLSKAGVGINTPWVKAGRT